MKVLKSRKAVALLLVTGLVMYASAYVGRYSYSANISSVREGFNTDNATAGIALTVFFVIYGVGQLLHGIFAKHYKPKYFIAIALAASAASNLTVGLAANFTVVVCAWAVNAAAQSFLWCNLINTQTHFFSSEDLHKAVICNSMTYVTGLGVSYALSALFTAAGNWRAVFYFAAALLAVMAVVWFLIYRYLEKNLQNDGAEAEETNAREETQNNGTKGKLFTRYFILVFSLLGLLAMCKGASDQGLNTWQPTILYDLFGIDRSWSIVLSIIPAIAAVLSVMFITRLKKKLPKVGYMTFSGVFYALGALVFLAACLMLNVSMWVYLVLYVLLKFLIGGVGNIITSRIPFSLRSYGNSGAVSSILDACVYAGEATSSIVFGAIADAWGWTTVLYLCCAVIAFGAACGIIGGLLSRKNEITRNM